MASRGHETIAPPVPVCGTATATSTSSVTATVLVEPIIALAEAALANVDRTVTAWRAALVSRAAATLATAAMEALST